MYWAKVGVEIEKSIKLGKLVVRSYRNVGKRKFVSLIINLRTQKKIEF